MERGDRERGDMERGDGQLLPFTCYVREIDLAPNGNPFGGPFLTRIALLSCLDYLHFKYV